MVVAGRTWAARFLPILALGILGLASTVGALKSGTDGAIGIGGALVLGATAWIAEGRFPKPETRVVVLLGVFLAVCAAASMNAPSPAVAWPMTAQLASVFVPLAWLSSPALQGRVAAGAETLFRFWPWLVLGGMVVLGFYVLDLTMHGSPLDKNRSVKLNKAASCAMLIAWPVLAFLFVRARPAVLTVARISDRVLVLGIGLAVASVVILTQSVTTKLAVGAAVLVMGATCCVPLMWLRRGLMILALMTVVWPFAARGLLDTAPRVVEHLPYSLKARFEIWDIMSFHIEKRPLFGYGPGGSRGLRPLDESVRGYTSVEANDPTVIVAHPHNSITQLWVELGPAGVALGMFLALALLVRIGRWPRTLQTFGLGAWTTGFVLSLAAYNLWTDAVIAAMALSAFGFGVVQKALPLSVSDPRA